LSNPLITTVKSVLTVANKKVVIPYITFAVFFVEYFDKLQDIFKKKNNVL
jgi:hypothetical protein